MDFDARDGADLLEHDLLLLVRDAPVGALGTGLGVGVLEVVQAQRLPTAQSQVHQLRVRELAHERVLLLLGGLDASG